jgi:hypothetical protein
MRIVRSVIAALLACLFVVMTAADKFACPDGCTDEAPAEATSQQPSSLCAICHGWSHTSAVIASRPAPRFIARQPIVLVNLTDPTLPAVERPPKTA